MTNLTIAFEYNELSPLFRAGQPLSEVSFLVGVDGGVKNVQSKPPGIWNGEKSKMLWKVGTLSPSGLKQGKIFAKFDVEGQSAPASLAIKFAGRGASLLGVDLTTDPQSAVTLTPSFDINTGKYTAYQQEAE